MASKAVDIIINPDYQELLPPLSTEEKEALRQSIENEGVRDPILVAEDGVLLDGHNRYDIANNACPIMVIPGSGAWEDDERRAYVFAANFHRRNLSPDQKREAHQKMRDTARHLNARDPKKFTQKILSRMFGVAQQTISSWLENEDIPITSAGNRNIDRKNKKANRRGDARVSIPKEEHPLVFGRYNDGISQEQLAADYGVVQSTISKTIKAEEKRRAKNTERKALAARGKKLIPDSSLLVGDFRELGTAIPDNTVDLIFTDPPYARDNIDYYDDLAALAARVLVPGGSCITYFGQQMLPDVIEKMKHHLRFWWTLACIHSGPTAKLPGAGIYVSWKPMIWFVKGKERQIRVCVEDSVVSKYEKEAHDWQQGLPEAKYYIEHLTPEKGLVLDPFCGGGTTCIAAKSLGRQYLAFDTDEEAMDITRGRLEEV